MTEEGMIRLYVSSHLTNALSDADEKQKSDVAHQILKQKELLLKQRNPIKRAQIVHALVDKFMKVPLSQHKAGCTKGCTYCCYHYVVITPDEAKLISRFCRKNNIEIDKKALQEQKDMDINVEKPDKYYSKCIFLNNNECSIYKVRPSSCRKYYTAGDPKMCDRKSGEGNYVPILFSHEAEIVASGAMNISGAELMAEELLKII